jgi:hypothetical protein
MYGNAPFAGDAEQAAATLNATERRRLRQDLANVAARTRDLLPDEYAVGLELAQNADGPRATVAVQPPVGAMVSAGYTPPADSEVEIAEDERADLAQGLAASAALQVKQVLNGDGMPPAQ